MLANAVAHPPLAHVENVWQLLLHVDIEGAGGGLVVGFKQGASGRLWVTKFGLGDEERTCVFAGIVDATGFGFGCRADVVHERFT